MSGILAHSMIVFSATPFGVHGDLGAIDAAMESGRKKARRATDCVIRCASEQIDKPLLVRRVDREDVDQGDVAVFVGKLFHGRVVC